MALYTKLYVYSHIFFIVCVCFDFDIFQFFFLLESDPKKEWTIYLSFSEFFSYKFVWWEHSYFEPGNLATGYTEDDLQTF